MDHPEAGSGLQDLVRPVQEPNGHCFETRDGHLERKNDLANVAICASPAQPPPLKRRRTEPPEKESLGEILRLALVDHQLGLSLNLIILLGLTYVLFPSLRQRVEPFFWPQYVVSKGQYAQGPRDMYLVAGIVVAFTGLRASLLDYVFAPFAHWLGIRSKKGKIRFTEQSYLFLYYAVYLTWGIYLFIEDTPSISATSFGSYLDAFLTSIWVGFPRLTLTPGLKLYYLSQTAFWVQQLYVIHIEEPRKDHWQMFTHHLVTIGLLVFSYGFRQLRAGNAFLVLMDSVDLIFPFAKILRYLGYQTACDIAFGAFVVVWLFARHICYMAVCWSIYIHLGITEATYGTYSTITGEKISNDGGKIVLDNLLQSLLNPSATTVSFNPSIRAVFLGLLLALQAITIAWGFMICRVVARVLRGEGADDTRSDDEGEDEEEVEVVKPTSNGIPYKLHQSEVQAEAGAERPQFIEVPASSEDLKYATRTSNGSKVAPNKRKSKGISSGLKLGEHKEILNRIGCLSDEQLARERERREEKDDNVSPRPGSSGRRKQPASSEDVYL